MKASMKTFAESIAESFESEVNVNWRLDSKTHAVASFAVKSIGVEVDFEQRERDGAWHVAFNTVRADLVDRANITLAFPIFNGVFQCVREFAETRQPEVIVFIAKDEDLAGVYQIYLRREKPSIEELGYTIEGPNYVAPYTEWVLRRVKPSAWLNL
jgi:hypothetical protein